MKIYEYNFVCVDHCRRKGRTEDMEKARTRLMERVQKLEKGDQVQLGEYLLPGCCKPNDVKVKMPIFWSVLHREGTKLLLLSNHCLDWDFYDGSGPFFGPAADTQWCVCDIRKWLNGTFYEDAFRAYEKRMILETEVLTEDSAVYQTKGGSMTRDRLFLLSVQEMDRYLKDSELAVGEILCADSPLHGDHVAGLSVETFPWWLRTPGGAQNRVAVVCESGCVDLDGMDSDADEVGIRPAMWIDVSRIG